MARLVLAVVVLYVLAQGGMATLRRLARSPVVDHSVVRVMGGLNEAGEWIREHEVAGLSAGLEADARELEGVIAKLDGLLGDLQQVNPSEAAALRQQLTALRETRELLLQARRSNLLSKQKVVLEDLKQRVRNEMENAQTRLTSLFVQQVTLQHAMAGNQRAASLGTVGQVVRSFLDAVEAGNLSAARDLLSAEAKPEFTPRRLFRLMDLLPRDRSTLPLRQVEPGVTEVLLENDSGRAQLRIILDPQGIPRIDDLSL